MKKFLLMLLSLMMICCGVLAEEAAVEETADAITAATLNITQLPEVEAQDNGILVVFSPRTIRRVPRLMPSRRA